jgi:hypothetical protein
VTCPIQRIDDSTIQDTILDAAEQCRLATAGEEERFEDATQG